MLAAVENRKIRTMWPMDLAPATAKPSERPFRPAWAYLPNAVGLTKCRAGVFDDLPRSDLFVDSYHFGDKRNRIIAERLFAELLPLLE